MLRQILDAFGGVLPDDVEVIFNNTGLEHPATYAFVREVSARWLVQIVWLEYMTDEDGDHAFREVTFETASRNGEPFDALIAKKQYLPNPVARICTVNLKMRTSDRYLRSVAGFRDGYDNAIGLRYDEPHRVNRIRADNGRERIVCPMYEAKHTLDDVLGFWKAQPFDLELPFGSNLFGNCVGCFLKARSKLETIALEMPEAFDWWIAAENRPLNTKGTGDRFRSDRPSYEAMRASVQAQGCLFSDPIDDSVPCMCHD